MALSWVWSIGVTNRRLLFAAVHDAYGSKNSSLFRHFQYVDSIGHSLPTCTCRSRDLACLCGQTMTKLITSACAQDTVFPVFNTRAYSVIGILVTYTA